MCTPSYIIIKYLLHAYIHLTGVEICPGSAPIQTSSTAIMDSTSESARRMLKRPQGSSSDTEGPGPSKRVSIMTLSPSFPPLTYTVHITQYNIYTAIYIYTVLWIVAHVNFQVVCMYAKAQNDTVVARQYS